ncbi:MAG: sigma-54 dependent transcriptional regulator [Desulfobacteraceae bacterium]|jgi:DNA-binding NtrC family response regulator
MIKDVLVICSIPEVIALIENALSETAVIRSNVNIDKALTDVKRQFDLIFIDLILLGDDIAAPLEKTILHFRKYNPQAQFVALTPKETVRRAVEAVKLGVNDYLTYPMDSAEIHLVLETAKETTAKNLELEYLRDKFWKADWLEIIRTNNPVMRLVYENVRSVAPTIATVLLLGETGTGKGLMARLIHWHSHRSDGPFVAVHCGAIPETLIESELFGHEKGAFTGADRRRIGKFEMARDGTIFLDEIGTITPAAQIKLLQVLQDGTFSRLGAQEQLRTNARIITATNADLQQMADAGAFRRDLLYRLNVFPIEIPPLKDRLEDLPHLIDLFLANLNAKYGKAIKGVHPGVKENLQTYLWPGNLRELENVLERAYILETGDVLMPDRFPRAMMIDSKIDHFIIDNQEGLTLAKARQLAIDEFERLYLIKLLKKHKGRINSSAAEAGVTPRQLSRLVSRHGLDKKKYRQ